MARPSISSHTAAVEDAGAPARAEKRHPRDTRYHGQTLYPSDVLIRAPEGGLTQDSVILGLHIRAIDRRRLGPRLGRVSHTTLRQIEEAILQVLDIQP